MSFIMRKARVFLIKPDRTTLFISYPKEHDPANTERFFTLPGGCCDLGELPQVTAVREVLEELNVSLDIHRLQHVTTSISTEHNSSICFFKINVALSVMPYDAENADMRCIWTPIDELCKEIDINNCSPQIIPAYHMLKGV